MSLLQEQIDARGDREVKLQTAWRQRIEYHYDFLRESGGSRGRQGAGDASVDATLACARFFGQASAQPARGSLGGLAAASAVAIAAPHSVAAGGATQLAPERVE